MIKLIKWLNPPRYRLISKIFGGMSEWSNEHAWKACIPRGIMGSNPIPSTIFSSYSYKYIIIKCI